MTSAIRIGIFTLVCMGISCTTAYAYTQVVVDEQAQDGIISITDPEIYTQYYGTLEGYPHTYEIRMRDGFELAVSLMGLPDTEEHKAMHVIIVEETGFRGKVAERIRVMGSTAVWEPIYDWWGGHRLQSTAVVHETVGGGVYRIEVAAPDNTGRYVLSVGSSKSMFSLGYLERLKRMYAVEQFLGGSVFGLVWSPFVYIPLIVVWCGFMLIRLSRRETHPRVL